MPIPPITNSNINTQTRKKPNYVKITGYAAVGAGVVSGFAAKGKKWSLHKNLAYLAGLFTAAHIGILEWYRHKK